MRIIIISAFLLLIGSITVQGKPEKELTHVKNARHRIIYHQENRFAGWPANNGAWLLNDDNILVAFTEGAYDLRKGRHNVSDPLKTFLARSTDGGETWKAFDPDNFVGDFGDEPELKKLNKPINFKTPGFAMRVVGAGYHGALDHRSHFFYSYNGGKKWNGPFSFGDLLNDPNIKELGLNSLTPRTDYIIFNKKECLIMFSVRDKSKPGTDKLFCVKTDDGGMTFKFQSWIVKPHVLADTKSERKVNLYNDDKKNPYATECRAVMSQTLKLDDGSLISVMRRKYMPSDQPAVNWLDIYTSNDKGKNWSFLAKAADTGVGNGNPPGMTQTKDGRLCLVYGERKYGTIQTVYSKNNGKTWSEPQILMDGYWSEDMELNDLGYPRVICREDGKLVAMYYYSTKENLHHLRATIWEP